VQPLGAIPLLANEDEEVDIFEWCGLAVKAKDASNHELEGLRASLDKKDDQIKKLEGCLAELVKLKNDNETQLLEKFSLLLNEKKLKIRDQQRLLSCANVDPAKLAEVEASRTAVSSRSPEASRKGKRKADQNHDSDDASDAGFEKMEVDGPPAEDSEQEQAQTPDDSTTDEAESDDEPVVPSTRRSGNNTKDKEIPQDTTSKAAGAPRSLPPKRELPFSRKPPATLSKPELLAAFSQTAHPAEGSETESDDEL